MKKNASALIILIIFTIVIGWYAYTFSQRNAQLAIAFPLWTPLPAHQIEQLQGWKVKWQVFNMAIAYTEDGPYMQANNGKFFYMGSLGNEPINRIIALNAADGSLAMKTDPIENNAEFLVDDSALYIGKFISEIEKYDLVTQKQVWTQTLGNSHSPCCFSLVNHELQSSWYSSRFYIQSIEDGEIIQEMKDTQKRIYRIENGITYSGGGGFLTAQNTDQSVLWETELKPFPQPPVFTKDVIYVRAGDGMGSVYTLDRASGQIRWQTAPDVIGNLAVSDQRVYYLTYDGRFLGLNANTGLIERSAVITPSDLYPITTYRYAYETAYEDKTQTVILILGNSSQMIAFTE